MTDWLRRWYRDVPATTTFTLLAVVVWLLTAVQSRSIMANLSASSLADSWILWGPAVLSSPLGMLRAVGAIFLHVDLSHLAINALLLMLIGREVERHSGTPLYVATFFAGGLGSSAAVLWMAPITPTAGASGAIYALMVLLVGVAIQRGADLRAPVILIVINLVYTFLSPGVSLWGHLGGLLAGLVMLWFVIHRDPRVRWAGVMATLFAAVAAIVGWTMDTGGPALTL